MKKIIVIEDNLEIRENLSEILELSGYDVVQAENGKSGVQKIKESKPDLILCDVMMPELDGFGVLKIIQKIPDLKHTPFMFLTAKAEKTDFRKGMGLGADDYITKPYDDVELLEAVEMRLKKSENISFVDPNSNIKTLYDESKGKIELNNLVSEKEIRKYGSKEIIFEVGQYPKWIYYLEKGKIKTYITNEFGKELITHIYGTGDLFGFIPHINSTAYEQTAATLEKCTVRVIPEKDFNLLLYNNKDFSLLFNKMLAQQARINENKLIEFAYSSVRKKVANALLMMHYKSEKATFKSMREDLASLAGTAKETTIRTLSDFKSEGLININHHEISILDIEGLNKMPQ